MFWIGQRGLQICSWNHSCSWPEGDNIVDNLNPRARNPWNLNKRWRKERELVIQQLTDNHDMQRFFSTISAIYSLKYQGPTSLRAKYGWMLFWDRQSVNSCWMEHRKVILNHNSNPDSLSQHNVQSSLPTGPNPQEIVFLTAKQQDLQSRWRLCWGFANLAKSNIHLKFKSSSLTSL